MLTTRATGMRRPRMQGSPPICFGLMVMRGKAFTAASYNANYTLASVYRHLGRKPELYEEAEVGVLRQHGTDFAKCHGELIGVIGRGIFELREEAVDGGANFGGVGWLGVFAIGRCRANPGPWRLVPRRDSSARAIFSASSGNALQHAQSYGLIVLHGCQSPCNPLRQRHGGRCR